MIIIMIFVFVFGLLLIVFHRVGEVITVNNFHQDIICKLHENAQIEHGIVMDLLKICKSHDEILKKMEDKNEVK